MTAASPLKIESNETLAALARTLVVEGRMCTDWSTDRKLAHMRQIARRTMRDAGMNTAKIDADIKEASL